MIDRIITFSNLFPSASRPTHGLFIQDRMRRVAKELGVDWKVVSPVATAPWPVRWGDYRLAAGMPESEEVSGVEVRHPRYFHLPKLSLARQARRMAKAALPAVKELSHGVRAVIDAHYVYPDGVAALMIAAKLNMPCVVTARGTDVNVLGDQPSVRAQIREHAPVAQGLFAVSSALRSRFVEVAGVRDDAVLLARNGVDLDRFSPGDRQVARQTLGLPSKGALVLGVGRLVHAKGFQLAAQAVKNIPGAALVLAGEDSGDGCRETIARSGCETHFLGALPPERVAVAYRACDVMVLPSQREGWPNVVTEALSSGLPVVASPVGGIPEILTDEAFGALVSRDDADALALAIRGFIDHPPAPEAIRAFAARYSWEDPVAFLVGEFRKILT